jgi:hypothetical protein
MPRCSVRFVPLGSDAHRRLGIELFNQTWTLMEAGDPTMVTAAYASLYHWSQVARPAELCRGEWLVAHVWCVIGEAGPAHRHALAAWEIGEGARWSADAGFADFDRPYALEGLARAAAATGDLAAAKARREEARAEGERIADDGDRAQFAADLDAGPWFGL